MAKKSPELSIVLPCRNEEKAIGFCVERIKKVINEHKIDAEIVVSDSSIDRSPEIAEKLGAKIVRHGKKGYGIAYLEGFKAARGKYILCADADGTYDFDDIPKFLHYLRQDYDFVIGNRLKGRMEKGVMPPLHKYIGNPVLSFILRLFFKSKVSDSHCGIRAIRREALKNLDLKTIGMEFASEMIIKAAKNKLKVKEFPVKYFKRIGPSKLSSFSDGWRHLRFMLMYAPNYLFVFPGTVFFMLGASIMTLFMAGPIKIDGLTLHSHPMILGSFLTILGYQIIALGIYAKTYAVSIGFEKKNRFIANLAKLLTFESGLIVGGIILLISFILGLRMLLTWIIAGFPGMFELNSVILILTLGIIGIQTIFSAFFLSIMLVQKK